MTSKGKLAFADDDTYTVSKLVLARIPPLVLGLALGFILSFVTSKFEDVLSRHIEAVFFIPFIVYMADAVGTQTQTIYIRDVTRGRASFFHYLIKETALGIILGLIFGSVAALVVLIWMHAASLALAVGIAMGIAISTAPIVALIVSEVLELEHSDPAVGAGPIATVIQDTISIVVYGFVTSMLLLPK